MWEKFKSIASRNGLEVSQKLEKIIMDEITEDFLNQIITDIKETESYEIDFEPLSPKGAL